MKKINTLIAILVFTFITRESFAMSFPFFGGTKVDVYAESFLKEYNTAMPEGQSKKAKQYTEIYKEAYNLLINNYIYPISESRKAEISQESKDALKKVLEEESKNKNKIEAKKVMEGVMGIVFNNIDAHTLWMSASFAKDFSNSLSGNYQGIGILFNADRVNKRILVLKVFAGGPAHKAGLMKGDYIYKIDERDIKNIENIETAVNFIRGEAGTNVDIWVKRGDRDLKLSITRGAYYVPSLEYYTKEDKYGIITIHSFNNDTASLFRNALNAMRANSLQGLIIDVRNNPGGLLTAVILMSDNILSGENIVSIKGREAANNKTFISINKTELREDLPIVVLTNSMSASASELLAGSLALNNRATLIGDSTFGKWSVQSSFELKDKSIFNITTQLFYAPKNATYQGVGLAPDIEVTSSTQKVYFRESDYKNALKTPDIDNVKRKPKLTVKDTSCPTIKENKDYNEDQDYVLGCALLYLQSSEQNEVFLKSLRK